MLGALSANPGSAVIKSFFFIVRLVLAWIGVFLLLTAFWNALPGYHDGGGFLFFACVITLGFVITGAFSHLRRVRLVAGHIDGTTLGNRQRRQIEIPFEAGEAFDLLDAAIRELPRSEEVESARDSLQIRAKVRRPAPYGRSVVANAVGRFNPSTWYGSLRNQIFATVTPGDGIGSVLLICEPESGAWSDWFRVDDGTNLENAEAITRAITRRIAERRRHEQQAAAQTATEKELTVARLNLLHAQVEPHFLYNTLASAQYLTRSEPAQADRMLGHLIQYLRHSLPRTEESLSTLGDELERTRAYLEILKLRMGPRLALEVDVPDALRAIALPPMMLQTLVENAIKHGLEPKPGGGTVWIRARRDGDAVSITIADNGQGFSMAGGGTGIGLKNVRERLRLIYGTRASLAVVANAPEGVAATLTVPAGIATPTAETSSATVAP
jgi:signal transduction histidine kinase